MLYIHKATYQNGYKRSEHGYEVDLDFDKIKSYSDSDILYIVGAIPNYDDKISSKKVTEHKVMIDYGNFGQDARCVFVTIERRYGK